MELESQFFNNQRVVGNLPYNIATPLILRLVTIPDVVDMYFMVQKEVASRLVASVGSHDFGRLSVVVQYHCEVEVLFDVAPSSFRPPPKVDSSFIRIRSHEFEPKAEDASHFYELVKQSFAQRRKTISNSLRDFHIDWKDAGINPQLRAQNLSVAEYVSLSNYLS